MSDPYESAGKALALREMQKKYSIEDDIAQIGAASGGDPEKMSQALLERGHYQPALQLRSQAASLKKEQRLTENAEIDRKLKLAEAAGSDAIALDAAWRQTLQAAGGNPQAALQQMQNIYGQVRQKWKGLGYELGEQFDPDANFASIGQAKESVHYLKSLADPKKPSAVQEYEYAVKQGYKGTFRDFELENRKAGATALTVNTGPMLPGKAGANKVDEDLLGVTRGLMQLDQIQSQFKPEFQQYMDKAGFVALSVKEKAGFKLTNKQQKDLTEFAAYRRNAVNSLNEYIKQITGAAMSEPEARRILSGMPKPGDGIFDGDSPTEFKSKLDDAMQKTKMAVARLAYIKRNGMSLEDGQGNATVPLERMPQLINDRGREIESELKKTGVSGRPLERAVRRQLGVEFGLVSD